MERNRTGSLAIERLGLYAVRVELNHGTRGTAAFSLVLSLGDDIEGEGEDPRLRGYRQRPHRLHLHRQE